MATTGYSTNATTTPATTPGNTVATPLEKAMLRDIAHLRKKLASRVDGYVEPDDPNTDDYMKNTRREL